jgi:DNA invertase Pin-like site-specific DNA recombinase
LSQSSPFDTDKPPRDNEEPLTPVAQYVRMSTEHQQYSTENQKDTIAQYAAQHGMRIVRTYADHGRSGLNLKGRAGLQELLSDVSTRKQDYEVVLIYDMSRWGRFQDMDESVFHEFFIRQTGIRVEYCAEQFSNDGSMISNLMKYMSRYGAGEQSRILSIKVFEGQCRLIGKGYRQGGPAGFGLRRMLLKESGDPDRILEPGQRKSLQMERVILVPGPDDEVCVVNRIYRMFVEEGLRESEIVSVLNKEGIKTDRESPWSQSTIKQILTNEKYIGNNVFNRTSFKLKKNRTKNHRDEWIRAEGVFDAIVEAQLFAAAQEIMTARCYQFSDEEMLERLESLHKKRGVLSGVIINEAEGMPSSSVYNRRFGSLLRAYSLVGYRPDRDYRYIEINRRLRRMHPEIISKVESRMAETADIIERDAATDLLIINKEFTVSMVLSRHSYTSSGSSRWKIRFDTGLRPDITIAVRMNAGNESIQDYYLLPRIAFKDTIIRLKDHNGLALDAYRFDDLEFLFSLAGRVQLGEAA